MKISMDEIRLADLKKYLGVCQDLVDLMATCTCATDKQLRSVAFALEILLCDSQGSAEGLVDGPKFIIGPDAKQENFQDN